MRVFKFVSSIRSGLWFVPVMCVAAGVVLSFGTIAIDRTFEFELIPASLTGGPDAALAMVTGPAIGRTPLVATERAKLLLSHGAPVQAAEILSALVQEQPALACKFTKLRSASNTLAHSWRANQLLSAAKNQAVSASRVMCLRKMASLPACSEPCRSRRRRRRSSGTS